MHRGLHQLFGASSKQESLSLAPREAVPLDRARWLRTKLHTRLKGTFGVRADHLPALVCLHTYVIIADCYPMLLSCHSFLTDLGALECALAPRSGGGKVNINRASNGDKKRSPKGLSLV